ncbi:MAG TPA: phage baseplate assembly protein V [Thermoanaerobaculia bacterium]|nr:phage baseplate assembly protein V [Thermoanaerobaculia bacterium]
MIEETLTEMAERAADRDDRFYGVVTGTVINVADPMFLGRVQVQLPFVDPAEISSWARVAVPMAGIASGHYFIPNIGDEVLVAFEHGDMTAPYVIGSLWTATSPPPLPSPLPQVRMLKTLTGNMIMITELPPSITIQTATGNTILMSPAGIQITAGTSIVNMTPDGVTVTGANVNLVGTAAINLTAPNVTINGAAATNVQSGGVCNVTAPLVKIN